MRTYILLFLSLLNSLKVPSLSFHLSFTSLDSGEPGEGAFSAPTNQRIII